MRILGQDLRYPLRMLLKSRGLSAVAVLAVALIARPNSAQPLPGAVPMTAVAIGHEFRQDDYPAITATPDGSLWVAWLSFAGDRDDLAIRHYQNNKWSALQWVPGSSGDSWLPQVAIDGANGVWVIWSQQVKGNWDLYARRFDPARQEWSALERLTSDPQPDINPRLASNGKGQLALVWQGFRAGRSNIFLKTFDGAKWSSEIRMTNHEANDWEPAVALDSRGTVWVVYDSYRNGNYDVFMSHINRAHGRGVQAQAVELSVATTPLFESRATVAVDTADRVWVAWETGPPDWGKDQGYVIRDRQPGAVLGGSREPRIRCYENGRWREPPTLVAKAFKGGNTYGPHVFSDGRGSVWVAAKIRKQGYWEYWATHLDPEGWSEAFALPNSKGRSSTRVSAASSTDGNLWITWSTDNRAPGFYHRPLRQQVYAGMLPAVSASGTPALKPTTEEKVEVKSGHTDEAGDLQAIRSYTTIINGKKHRILRGDFHRHTELSWDEGGNNDGSLQDFYRYMIDVASMDFGASTDHQGGNWPYWWWYTQKMTDMYHVPGAYVPVFGYERSALFPNGHRNVFFAKRSESRITPHYLKNSAQGFGLPLGPVGDEPIGTGERVANDTKLFYEDIRGRNGISIPHTSGTYMGTDWRDNDPDLEPLVEVFQGARTSYEQGGAPLAADPEKDAEHIKRNDYKPEGMVSNAWAKGYKLGVIASSDHGSTHISYAMVYTDDPTRQGILNAIRKRHTYGATDNIILEVRMGEHFMGDEFRLDKAQPLRVKARGTRPVVRVDVIKDNKIIYSTNPNRQNVEFQFIDNVGISGRHFYYVRLQQEDQMMAWSSPMFINYRNR